MHMAIDIGASSGRLIAGFYEDGALTTKEMYRFENQLVKKGDRLCWDLEYIFDQILIGLQQQSLTPSSIGIDTWGVDFVLLDKDGNILGDAVSYRDNRTAGMDQWVYDRIPEAVLYEKTGIQRQIFTTIFQLAAIKNTQPEIIDRAEHFLMIPDYLNYRLSGIMANEYTNATTTGLVNAHTKTWDLEILAAIGIPAKIFKPLTTPGTVLGSVTSMGEICKLVAPATHDTASAVVMANKDAIYISSGTWSLMGVELDAPNTSQQSHSINFTNEGGYGGKFMYRSNIMGLWMIQSVRAEHGKKHSYQQLCDMAETSDITSIVDCNHTRFLSPASMVAEIQQACEETNQPIPTTIAQLAKVVYNSLATCYATTATNLEKSLGKTYDTINIIGGGASATYLNDLTAKKSGKKIITGPIEATAMGNLALQLLAMGKIQHIGEL